MRPGPEGRDPGRHREAGPVGADALNVAQEPGELDGKGSPEVGVDGPGTVRNGHGLRVEAGASRHLRVEGCRGCQEAVPKLVRLGARDAGRNRRTARANGPSCPNGRGSLGVDPGPLDSRSDDLLHGGSQQPLLSRETTSPRIFTKSLQDCHIKSYRWRVYLSLLLNHCT